MKIIVDKPGQTCNRLWSYVALVSEAITLNNKVAILNFDITINDFPNMLKSEYIIFPYFSKYLIRFFGIKKYLFYLNKILFNRFIADKTVKWWSKKGEIVNGWDFKGNDYDFEKNKELIRHIFQPSEEILEIIDEKINLLRKEYDEIVGVHIRRGDYATWLNGIYFFEIEHYYKCMLSYFETYEHERKICFFISSDENVDLGSFGELKCFKHQNSSAILDLYSIASCDKILGPRSTFSRWASFYGKVPLRVLEKEDLKIQNDDFSILKSLYIFENGCTYPKWTSIEQKEMEILNQS